MLDEEYPRVPGESVGTSGAGRDTATTVRDGDSHRTSGSTSRSTPGGTSGAAASGTASGTAGLAQQADPLPFLIADAEAAALGRTVLAVAAMHEPDQRGRCRVCSPRWRWWRSREESWCSTRRMLWATLVGSQPTGAG